ncbi:5693_t:CDS:10 [Dentiscutata heterogama]|uniref:5693_t:CDS:1 n=1 Tax=Dentiscutata heterogama TaxID=1316150 RepID=A0ACA9LF04_9GLOM|nr:5693_t:CDS:10 [Dentiscutata heterogama]
MVNFRLLRNSSSNLHLSLFSLQLHFVVIWLLCVALFVDAGKNHEKSHLPFHKNQLPLRKIHEKSQLPLHKIYEKSQLPIHEKNQLPIHEKSQLSFHKNRTLNKNALNEFTSSFWKFHREDAFREAPLSLSLNLLPSNTKQNFSSSKLCDPNVKQYSGYIQTSDGSNMFFWFFESRNNPTSSPLTLFLNGGPGCSSMIGLFQEIGPCTSLPNGTNTTINPYSWNNVSNLLFVDQPNGAGFSYGSNYTTSSQQAASNIYEFLKSWVSYFPEYAGLPFHVFGESYAGHYTTMILSNTNDVSLLNLQTSLLSLNIGSSGSLMNLKTIGIGDGWIDPMIQYASLIDYSQQNSLHSSDVLANMSTAYPTCKSLLSTCYNTSTNKDCSSADDYCYDHVFTPFASNLNCNIDDIRASWDSSPPEDYINYLSRPDVMSAIGAKIQYTECSDDAYMAFTETADLQVARTTMNQIIQILNYGIPTLLYFGDSDANCNWIGGLNISKSLNWKYKTNFNSATLRNFIVNNKPVGQVQSSNCLTFLKMNQAGHEVPFYQPQNSLQMFTRWINNRPM